MEPEKKRPKDAVESFVHNMMESSKETFDKPKPNESRESPEEIEKITGKIRERLQRG